MSRRQTNVWDFLTKLLDAITTAGGAILGTIAMFLVVLLFTPIGWMGIMIMGVLYMLFTGDRGTYP